jgi:NRPS condensation-like uncharacterized protein
MITKKQYASFRKIGTLLPLFKARLTSISPPQTTESEYEVSMLTTDVGRIEEVFKLFRDDIREFERYAKR